MFVMISGAETAMNENVPGNDSGAAWRRTMSCGRTPLASAVRTKSSSVVSRVIDSVSRRHMAPSGAPSTIHGGSNWRNHSHGAVHGCTPLRLGVEEQRQREAPVDRVEQVQHGSPGNMSGRWIRGTP
jgi:hypothetical protein